MQPFMYVKRNPYARLIWLEDNHVRSFAPWDGDPNGGQYVQNKPLSRSQKRGWVFVGSVWAILGLVALLG